MSKGLRALGPAKPAACMPPHACLPSLRMLTCKAVGEQRLLLCCCDEQGPKAQPSLSQKQCSV